jgi:hypothetical protein
MPCGALIDKLAIWPFKPTSTNKTSLDHSDCFELSTSFVEVT